MKDPTDYPLHHSHRAVRMLDRTIRRLQRDGMWVANDLQFVRKALAGKPLRAYLRSGKHAKQRRLDL